LCLDPLDFTLDVLHVRHRHHDIEHRVNQPKYIVDVVELAQPLLVIGLQAHRVEVQGVVSEEVDDQCDVGNRAGEDHALGRRRVQVQTVLNSGDEGDLLAESQHFAHHRHGGFQFRKTLHKRVVVSALSLERRQDSHQEVLDDTA